MVPLGKLAIKMFALINVPREAIVSFKLVIFLKETKKEFPVSIIFHEQNIFTQRIKEEKKIVNRVEAR